MASLGVFAGSAVLAPLIKTISAIVIFNLVYELLNSLVDGVRMNIMGWESFGYAWYVWIICQLLDDFSYYWFHRQNHNVRFLWAAHIVHHAKNIEYTDKNHGGFLNIFDKVYGTWKELDKDIDIEYGVTHPPESYNLFEI